MLALNMGGRGRYPSPESPSRSKKTLQAIGGHLLVDTGGVEWDNLSISGAHCRVLGLDCGVLSSDVLVHRGTLLRSRHFAYETVSIVYWI